MADHIQAAPGMDPTKSGVENFNDYVAALQGMVGRGLVQVRDWHHTRPEVNNPAVHFVPWTGFGSVSIEVGGDPADPFVEIIDALMKKFGSTRIVGIWHDESGLIDVWPADEQWHQLRRS